MASAVASQCRLANTCRVAKASRTCARRAIMPVRAAATKETSTLQKVTAAVLAAPASLLVSAPAFALVDDRLGGDGVGYPLGINDPVLFWVLFAVFIGVWAAYFSSQKDLGEFEDEDSGLSL